MNARARRGLSCYRRWCGSATTEIDSDRLEAYILHLANTVKPKTAMESLWGLLAAVRTLDPDGNYVWFERRLREAWAASPARTPRRNGPGRGGVNKARRRRLLVAEWPAAMREAWHAARAGSGEGASLLDEVEGRARVHDVAFGWSPDTVDQRERAMGAFLRHLMDAGLPLAVTPNGIESYIAAMREAGLAPKTVATRIVGILRLAEAMWPEKRWRWLQNRAYGLDRQAKRAPDVRSPAMQYVPLKGLRVLGQRMLTEARRLPKGRRAAAKFQEGLLLLFLTHHPVRRRNMTRLEVVGLGFDGTPSDTVGRIKIANGDFICVWPQTKTRPPAERLARPLIGPILEWLRDWRPCLAGPNSGNALWLSNAPGFIGAPLTENGLGAVVLRATAALGLPIRPHAIRYIAATTIVEFSPQKVGVISTLLGHRNPKSLRPYIRAASSIMAARLYEQAVHAATRFETPDTSFLPRRRFRLGRASGR